MGMGPPTMGCALKEKELSFLLQPSLNCSLGEGVRLCEPLLNLCSSCNLLDRVQMPLCGVRSRVQWSHHVQRSTPSVLVFQLSRSFCCCFCDADLGLMVKNLLEQIPLCCAVPASSMCFSFCAMNTGNRESEEPALLRCL